MSVFQSRWVIKKYEGFAAFVLFIIKDWLY